MKLTRDDYINLEHCYIQGEIADAAGIYRVDSLEGRDLVGRKGGGDYSGLAFPYRWPGTGNGSVLDRLRLDNPPIDGRGKKQYKYLSAPGARNRLYLPPCNEALLADISIPVVMTEGEKKVLGLWCAALEKNGASPLPYLPIGLPGVWNWQGIIGTRTNARGKRVPEKGVLPDFDRIVWSGRKVYILFDVNAAIDTSVQAARKGLARELVCRGAQVFIAELPASAADINGCDDFLYHCGVSALDRVLEQAKPYEWREELLVSDKGKVRPLLANVVTYLSNDPQWEGVLGWNEFALRIEFLGNAPYARPANLPDTWTDWDTITTTTWLQRKGLLVTGSYVVGEAIHQVARQTSFHPVREWLNNLVHDGTGRIDRWLHTYLGAEDIEVYSVIGKAWLISCVARIMKPGAQVDHVLILEGTQGGHKTTTLRTLGGSWHSDQVSDLGSKDASMQCAGVWIIELSELDSFNRADSSRIKSFLTRTHDRYRPPYGREVIEQPRQCVFAGSTNRDDWNRDETGARRMWPVRMGHVDIARLQQDREQLWAEAVILYRQGVPWWIDSGATLINKALSEEQASRFQVDAWTEILEDWLEEHVPQGGDVGLTECLEVIAPLRRVDLSGLVNYKDWDMITINRVGRILKFLHWERFRKRVGENKFARRYRREVV